MTNEKYSSLDQNIEEYDSTESKWRPVHNVTSPIMFTGCRFEQVLAYTITVNYAINLFISNGLLLPININEQY